MKLVDGNRVVEISEETAENFRKTFFTEKKKEFIPEKHEGFLLNGDETFFPSKHAGRYFSNYFNAGSYRNTKAGIKKEIAYRRALQRIRKWKADNCEMREEGKDKYGIGIWSTGSTEIKSWHGNFHTGCPIGYFKSSKEAKACLAACYNDLLTIIRDGYK